MKDSLRGILAKIEKDTDLRIGPLSMVGADVQSISTGNIGIDHIIGINGLPVGRSVELFGQPSSGKTTTALQTAAAFQKTHPDRYIVYLDYEQSVDKDYAAALGLDCDAESFLFTQPDNLEQGIKAVDALLETGEIGIIIFDSVAAMTPSDELEEDITKSLPMLQARLMSKTIRRLNASLAAHDCTAIFLNHVRDVVDMGGRGYKGQTTPGGTALKFYASLRLQFTQIATHLTEETDSLTGEKGKQQTQTTVKIKVVKNKVGPPFRSCTARVVLGEGFSNVYSALSILKGRGIIKSAGAIHYFDGSYAHDDMDVTKDRKYIRGEGAILRFAKEHPEWETELIEQAGAVLFLDQANGKLASMPDDVIDEDVSFGGASELDDLLAAP